MEVSQIQHKHLNQQQLVGNSVWLALNSSWVLFRQARSPRSRLRNPAKKGGEARSQNFIHEWLPEAWRPMFCWQDFRGSTEHKAVDKRPVESFGTWWVDLEIGWWPHPLKTRQTGRTCFWLSQMHQQKDRTKQWSKEELEGMGLRLLLQ